MTSYSVHAGGDPMSAAHRPCVHLVAGARPNFMKIAPLVRALRIDGRLSWKIVHTGQHYDRNMNAVFFEELGIPAPDVNFNCGGGSHASQTARIMEAFEQHCIVDRPDAVVVVGDVNSTVACAIVTKKAGIRLAHVEAGLRSGDLSMPEEINRIVTDSIADWFFVTEPDGQANLRREGRADDCIYHVGHVMVDNLLYQVAKLSTTEADLGSIAPLKKRLGRYGVVTLHRPSNVDDARTLASIIDALNAIAEELPLIFPVHPRTRANIGRLERELSADIHMMSPQAYMPFLSLWKDAVVVLTDSGGLQEETTALGVPCVTIRESTERPITVSEGTNTLAGTRPDRIVELAQQAISGRAKKGKRPVLWDGHAAERIVDVLAELLGAEHKSGVC
ncbi:MAG: UDP-N-acetylglucosamine 2-epimerase (non-hydrolyzing) [Burkholderiales bacterium]